VITSEISRARGLPWDGRSAVAAAEGALRGDREDGCVPPSARCAEVCCMKQRGTRFGTGGVVAMIEPGCRAVEDHLSVDAHEAFRQGVKRDGGEASGKTGGGEMGTAEMDVVQARSGDLQQEFLGMEIETVQRLCRCGI